MTTLSKAPALPDAHSSSADLLNPTSLARLLPVQDLIIDQLIDIAPVWYLLLSKAHYDNLIPSLYSTITLDQATLYGLTLPWPLHERTVRALSHVNTLIIDAEPSLLQLATAGKGPFPRRYTKLFPNVKRIILRSQALMHEAARPTPHIPIQNTLWFHVQRPLEELILDQRGVPAPDWEGTRIGIGAVAELLTAALLMDKEEAGKTESDRKTKARSRLTVLEPPKESR